MNARLPSAPSEASAEAPKPTPTEGGVSAEAKKEGQQRQIDAGLAEVEQKVNEGTAERTMQEGVDADQDEDTETDSAKPEDKPKTGWAGFVSSLSAGWGSVSKWLSDTGGKVGDWIRDLMGIEKGEESGTDSDEDEDTDSDFALDTDTLPSQPQGFLENMKTLLAEFGLTETTDKKRNFFMVATELGKEVEAKYHIPYQVVVAQACLESGFGQSDLTQKALNCFGYKTGSSKVPYVTMETTEYRNGVRGREPAHFRSYSNLRESFMDYGKLLSGASRYRKAFDYKDDPKRFLEEVIKGGYATDPNYVAKAEKTVATYGLNLA